MVGSTRGPFTKMRALLKEARLQCETSWANNKRNASLLLDLKVRDGGWDGEAPETQSEQLRASGKKIS